MKELVKKIKSTCLILISMLLIFNFIDILPVANAAGITLYAPTSVRAIPVSYNSVKCTWGAVVGASGYRVYRAASSTGTYFLVFTTTGRSYTNTGLATGRTYYYKVRAYRTVGTTRVYSNYSAAASAKPIPSAPTSVKAIPVSYNSTRCTWGAVAGASGYRVYRAISSTGTYFLVSSTTGRSYTNTGLATGRTYYYKVRAYSTVGTTKVYSSYSAAASAKPIPSAPTSVKAIPVSYNSTKCTWGAVDGASGYRVYRAISSTGTYFLVSSTTGRSYTDTGLAAGRTYYYKVRAYRTVGTTRVYSNYSAAASAKPILPAPTSLKAVATAYNRIYVSWSGVTGASSYEVYKASSKTGTYTLLTTVNSVNCSNTGLSAGTTYYYKVRAFRTIGSVRVYSAFSPVMSVTTPVIHVTSVSLNKTADVIVVGGIDTLTASIAPANALNKAITWKSSDNSTATVDNTGKVTAVSAGTAIITVTTTDGSHAASCTVTVNKAQIKGIDVSKWQGTINWVSVRNAGVQFTMVRSSYGDGTSAFKNNGVDPMFETNYAAAKANGIAVGAYHYSYATTVEEAVTEANFMIGQLKGKQFDYPVCVDIEDPSQDNLEKETLTDIALTYLDKLKQAGYYPIIYASKYWFTSVLDDTRLASYDHWLAEWGPAITYPGEAGMWQYSSTLTVNGIPGYVDMDTSFVDYTSRIKSLHLNGF